MFGGINPKQMQGMMKKMGIAQNEILAEKVVIHKKDGSKIIIEDPSVLKVTMQGQASYQISGTEKEESAKEEISENDIKMVMEKTGCTKEKAKKSLEKTHDLAESILELIE